MPACLTLTSPVAASKAISLPAISFPAGFLPVIVTLTSFRSNLLSVTVCVSPLYSLLASAVATSGTAIASVASLAAVKSKWNAGLTEDSRLTSAVE